MIFKIIGFIWGGFGTLCLISSCSSWIGAGKAGDHVANYAASEVFVIRMIFYFFIFIMPGLILIYMGRKKPLTN